MIFQALKPRGYVNKIKANDDNNNLGMKMKMALKPLSTFNYRRKSITKKIMKGDKFYKSFSKIYQ